MSNLAKRTDLLADAGVSPAPRVTYSQAEDPFLRRALIRAVERVTGQPRLQRLYADYHRFGDPDPNFWRVVVQRLRLTVTFDPVKLSAIPATGPLILVSNHPLGMLDGVTASYLLSLVRNDFRLLAHATFRKAPEIQSFLIPIHFDGASTALRANIEAKRSALRHIEEGGSLIIFPAGRTSTAPRTFGRATDDPWKLFAATLIARSGATVVPLFLEGQAGWMFHFVSKFSETLREALLLREVVRRFGREVVAHIGAPLDPSMIGRCADRQALLDDLRAEVYALAP